jgi:hypothetical protein
LQLHAEMNKNINFGLITGNRISPLIQTRVTRFAEFPPIGRLFYFEHFLKITEVAEMFWLLFTLPMVKVMP